MASILSIISIVSFVLAAICLALAIFFWFWFNIPSVVGDLSGRTARKSIAKIREGNEKSGEKGFRPSAVNSNRGKVTSTMPQTEGKKSGGLKAVQVPKIDTSVTEVLAENQAETIDETETELLMTEDSATTTLLVEDGVDVSEPVEMVAPSPKRGKQLVMLDDVVLIHTEEVLL